MIRLLIFALLLAGCGSKDNSQKERITNIGTDEQIKVFVRNQSSMEPERFARYLAAQTVQLQRDVRPNWGVNAVVIEGDSPNGERQVFLRDTLAGTGITAHDSVYGFHNSRRQGFVNYLRTERDTGMPEGTASHEVLELLLNEACVPTGYEICDPVNHSYYRVDGVPMHNFCLPSFYNPNAPGPWDYMGLTLGVLVPMPGRTIFATVHQDAAAELQSMLIIR